MDLKPTPLVDVFPSFTRKRNELNQRLDDLRRAVDEWLNEQTLPLPLRALAQFEVMLKERRETLTELIALDEELIRHLLQSRDGHGEGPG